MKSAQAALVQQSWDGMLVESRIGQSKRKAEPASPVADSHTKKRAKPGKLGSAFILAATCTESRHINQYIEAVLSFNACVWLSSPAERESGRELVTWLLLFVR